MQGFSVGGSGAVVQRWRLFANYTLLRSRIRLHTNPLLVGQALPGTPEQSPSLWTTVTPWGGFRLGGGATHQARMAVNNPASAMQVLNRVPSFWRFDASASHTWRRVELQLNVANLTDAVYYEQTTGSRAVPGRGFPALLIYYCPESFSGGRILSFARHQLRL